MTNEQRYDTICTYFRCAQKLTSSQFIYNTKNEKWKKSMKNKTKTKKYEQNESKLEKTAIIASLPL